MNSELLIKDDTIEVYLAGPGFGEGALIIVGGTIVIGIDSCLSFVQRSHGNQNFLEDRLNAIGDQLRFYWILTHFHSDHFQSFSSVLNQFGHRLNGVVVPLDYTSADIAANLAAYDARSQFKTEAEYNLERGEYRRIRRLLDSEPLQHLYMSGVGKQVLIETEVIITGKRTVPLEVSVHGLQRNALNEILGKATRSAIDYDLSRDLANSGSLVVYVRFGKFEGFFPGDAPCDRTVQVLSLRNGCDAEIVLLKVAHHGSDDGTNKAILAMLRANDYTKRQAIIAPFKRHNLPKDEIIQLLKDHDFDIDISGGTNSAQTRDAIQQYFQLVTNISLKQAIAPMSDIILSRFIDL